MVLYKSVYYYYYYSLLLMMHVIYPSLSVCLSVCHSSVCLCVVSETRRLKVEDCPLSICLSWLQCGGLDRHQFILVENDASEVDVSCATAACTHTHTHTHTPV